MQVLKEEVRQRILKSSRKEFRKKGFDKASMRNISSTAGMTVGNLYRYYKNKEDLYGAIVGDLYAKLKDLKSGAPEDPEKKINWLLEEFKTLQSEYKNEWLILFEGAAGTKYKRVVTEISNLLRRTIEDVLEAKGKKINIAAPVASAITFGLNTILKTEKKNSEVLAEEFLDYMMGDLASRVS